jgi:lipopolysaccharide transport system ATP-binding protein
VQITASIPALRPGEYLVALGLDDGIPGAHRLLCHVYDSWVLRVSMPTGGRFQSGYVQISGTSISFLEKSE